MNRFMGILLIVVTLFSLKSFAATGYFDGLGEQAVQTKVDGGMITEYSNLVIITLEGADISSMEQVQSIIAKALHLPNTYGKNLDALYDVLTDTQVVSKTIDISLISGQFLSEKIGEEKVDALVKVMSDAQEKDPQHVTASYWQ